MHYFTVPFTPNFPEGRHLIRYKAIAEYHPIIQIGTIYREKRPAILPTSSSFLLAWNSRAEGSCH